MGEVIFLCDKKYLDVHIPNQRKTRVMLIRKAFRYRLYPNTEQQKKLAVQFGHARFVWNWGLNLRKTAYKETGKGIPYHQLAGKLVELKGTPEAEWLKEANSQALQQKLQDLDQAYTNFFAKRARFPRFKSKRDNQPIRYSQRFHSFPMPAPTFRKWAG